MDRAEALFLRYLRSALSGGEPARSADDSINRVLRMARLHAVLPLVCEEIVADGRLREPGEEDARLPEEYRKLAIRQVSRQIAQVSDFLDVYQALLDGGLHPLIIKGVAVRHLYKRPYHRLSVDEDILIRPEEFPLCHSLLMDCGLELLFPEQDPAAGHEVSYCRRSTGLYIEVHKSLFAAESGAYGSFNRYFADVQETAVAEEITCPLDGQMLMTGGKKTHQIWTMESTRHLFYLVCHSVKHFVHSGFGIRPLCDIAVYGQAYHRVIDWKTFWKNCAEIHADRLVGVSLKIAEVYLGFAGIMEEFQAPEKLRTEIAGTDEGALLEDILRAGVHGNSSMSRLHSSNMTLRAVAAASDRSGEKSGGSAILHSVFLPLGSMRGRYTFLNKAPFLLPVAWGMRIATYLGETSRLRKKADHQNPNSQKAEEGMLEAVRIGKERIRLLEMYHIIE